MLERLAAAAPADATEAVLRGAPYWNAGESPEHPQIAGDGKISGQP